MRPMTLLGIALLLWLVLMGSAQAITTGGTLSGSWWINTTNYQARVTEGVIEDIYGGTNRSFNWGRDYGDDYGIGSVVNSTPSGSNGQLLGQLQTTTNCYLRNSNSTEYAITCNNTRAMNNWTFYDDYIKLETTALGGAGNTAYSVRHAISQIPVSSPTLKYAWNGTANKTATTGLTDWESRTGTCAYTQSNTAINNDIFAVTWNEATTTDVDYSTNQSLATTGCAIARASEIAAGTWLTQYIKILPRNTTTTGDNQVITAIQSFKANPKYPINTTSTPVVGDIYISTASGSDSNPGNSSHPIKTISKLATMWDSGETAYFKCEEGAIYRGPTDQQLSTAMNIPDGTAVDWTEIRTYGACNTTNKPKFTASVSLGTGNWTNLGSNIWKLTPSPGRPIANFILNSNRLGGANNDIAYRVYDNRVSSTYLNSQAKWGQNRSYTGTGDYSVYMYSTSNPASYYDGIEMVYADNGGTTQKGRVITIDNAQYINISGIEVMWADSGFNINYGDHIQLFNNSWHHIGGGYCYGGCTAYTRWGNAIQMWWGSTNIVINGNKIWETLDAAITTQGTGTGSYNAYNQLMTNNQIWSSEFCYEFFHYGTTGTVHDLVFANNTCYQMGDSKWEWQRNNETDQTTRAKTIRLGGAAYASNVKITDNIMYDSYQYLVGVQASPTVVGFSSDSNYLIDYNYAWKNTTYAYDNARNWQTNGVTYTAHNAATYYRTFNDWQTGTSKDTHSTTGYHTPTEMFTNPEDTNNYNRDYTPRLAELCTASSTGDAVGALECTEGADDSTAISDLSATNITGTRLTLTWTNPTSVYFDHTRVYQDGTYLRSTTESSMTITGLTSGSTYNFTVEPVNTATEAGTADSILATTLVATDLEITQPLADERYLYDIDVLWTRGDIEGTPITNFTITIQTSNGTTYTLATNYADLNYTISTENYAYGNATIRVTGTVGANSVYDEVTIYLRPYTETLEVYVYDTSGEQLTDLLFTDAYLNDDQESAHYVQPIYYYLQTNSLTTPLNLQVEDLEMGSAAANFTLTVTRLNTVFNLTLNQTFLTLHFLREGVGTNTTGMIVMGSVEETGASTQFDAANLSIQQGLLIPSVVRTFFGPRNGSDYKQYYEYTNLGQGVSEELEVLERGEVFMYVKVMDQARVPKQDAIVRWECSNGTTNYPTWEYHQLISQRLTENNGMTFAWLDNNTACYVTASLEGYTTMGRTFRTFDENYDYEHPFIITLVPTTANFYDDGYYVYLPEVIYNKSEAIYGGIIKPSNTKVRINTTYRASTMRAAMTVRDTDCDEFGRCYFMLTPGTDFDPNTNDSINVEFYRNGEYWKTYTITYEHDVEINNVTPNLSLLDVNILNPLLWIALILMSLTVHLLIKGGEWGSLVFKAGAIIITFIQPMFGYVAGVIFLGLMMRWGVKRVIGEE